MAYLYNPELLQPQDVNGVPLAGAKLFFYTTGTTTPITVYQDSGLLTPHASPVVADASGIFAPIYTSGGTYKTVLQTSASVTVQTVDPVYGITPNVVVYDSQTLTAAQQEQARDNLGVSLRGAIWGLTLSNNESDAVNDIDIAAGEAASTETNPVLMVLASALTKRIDAAWAVGTGNGGIDTGSVTNASYHVWLIQRSDTGVTDALFSTSATSPTMPTNYDRKRRIGSLVRTGGGIKGFTQVGDRFIWGSSVNDRSNTGASASTLLALTVPAGIVVFPIVRQTQQCNSAGTQSTSFADAGAANVSAVCFTKAAAEIDTAIVSGIYASNTSSQLQFAVTISSGTLTANDTDTLGWFDRRGRDS